MSRYAAVLLMFAVTALAPATAVRADETVVVTAGDQGFGLKSADGSFEFRVKGLLQADARFFAGDEQAFKDTFLLRRVEPSFEVTLGKLAFLKLLPQFAGDTTTISDVYGELRFDPAATLRIGKFKAPFGLENLQAAGALAFMERGLPTELGAGRDFGVQLHGGLPGGGSYAVAWLNGSPDGRDAVASDTDDRKELAARLFFEPIRNFGFGIAGTTGRKAGATTSTAGVTASTATAAFNNTLPRYRSPGQNTIFSYRSASTPADADTVVAAGDHTRWSPQLYFYRGPFGLLGEYAVSRQQVSLAGAPAELEHSAYQAVVSWVLTGESAGYRGVRPAVPYASGSAGWGAFEIALRHGAIEIDDAAFPVYANPDTAVSTARASGAGLSWYATANVRLALNYERTAFEGGAPGGGDRDDESAVFSRVQLSF
jgi:phosphate-selective porin OprO/OprP